MTRSEKLLAAIPSLDELIECRKKQGELLTQLKHSLIREIRKVVYMDTIPMRDDALLGLMKAYVSARRAKAHAFEWDNKKFDTRYAGYLLEYMESRIPLAGFEHMKLRQLKKQLAEIVTEEKQNG